MVAKLVVEEGDLKGLTLSLEDGDTWTIGRDPDECQLVIEDPLVSRKHLVARRTSDGIVIENLSATNPVQVNDEEIDEQPRLLQNGDTLKVGNEVLRFYEDASARVLDEGIPEGGELEEIEATPTEVPSPAETAHPPLPPPPPTTEVPAEEGATSTIFGEENPEVPTLAEIDFGVVETGRWLLKVIGGPNNGAEFYMQAGNSYLLGTDPKTCDIVFHDTSVSRQHARITVSPEETLTIEDLKSRNGVLIGGTLIESPQTLAPNTIVTLGTTSFVIYDREGEMQTIISPLLPSIVKVLQGETPKTSEAAPAAPAPAEAVAPVPEPVPAPIVEAVPAPKPRHFGPYIIFATIIGLFALAAIGTTSLFHEEPVVMQTQENADELIQKALSPFPAIRYTFNKSSNSLLLLGHVTTSAEKSQLLYNLQGLHFIKSIDDTGVIIDDIVWHEVNSILAENPAWKGITVHSPAAGQFILTGYLHTRKQADQLSSYISLNFPYLDLLKKEIVVEEDVVNQIHSWLQDAQLPDITVKMGGSEVSLMGTVPPEKANDLNNIIAKIKQIPGVRVVNNMVRTQTAETGIVDISDQYPVTGKSRVGNKYTVVINGRILSENDDLDGMTITKITADRVLLEKDGTKYRIDY